MSVVFALNSKERQWWINLQKIPAVPVWMLCKCPWAVSAKTTQWTSARIECAKCSQANSSSQNQEETTSSRKNTAEDA